MRLRTTLGLLAVVLVLALPARAENAEFLDLLASEAAAKAAPQPDAACGSYIYSEPCQTGGWWSGSCSTCSGGTCYYRYEGTLYHYSGGIKASGFVLKTRCSQPSPSIATCNTNCT